MLNLFRAVSGLEGLSYLLILSVTFGLLSRDLVFYLGMGHGLLFMLYMALSFLVANQRKWSLVHWLLIFFASLIPLAFIPVELHLRKLEQGEAKAA